MPQRISPVNEENPLTANLSSAQYVGAHGGSPFPPPAWNLDDERSSASIRSVERGMRHSRAGGR